MTTDELIETLERLEKEAEAFPSDEIRLDVRDVPALISALKENKRLREALKRFERGDPISPEEARREANKLMASPAYVNRSHPDHASVVEQVQQLFERAYSDDL